jgi:hypothetical protein
MTLNKIPKYSKVELLFKEKNTNGLQSVTKLEFDDCGLMITGDYIVVITDHKHDIETSLNSVGKIYHLNNIDSYKTYSE